MRDPAVLLRTFSACRWTSRRVCSAVAGPVQTSRAPASKSSTRLPAGTACASSPCRTSTDRLQSQARGVQLAGQPAAPGMVTLRRAAGNQRRRASGQRLRTRVLKLPDLVAAAAQPAQVITLHPQGIGGQPHRSRQTRRRLQRGRPATQHDRRRPRIGRHGLETTHTRGRAPAGRCRCHLSLVASGSGADKPSLRH